MEWVIAGLAVVAIAFAAVASTGRGGSMPDLVDDREAPELPVGLIGAADLRRVRFAVVPRGYSMTQVDELLERLAQQLSAATSAQTGTGTGGEVSDFMAEPVSTPVTDPYVDEVPAR